jgi:hypothetical protein
MPLLWDVVATLGIGFERHDKPPGTVMGSGPRIILPQPMLLRRSVKQSLRALVASGNHQHACANDFVQAMDHPARVARIMDTKSQASRDPLPPTGDKPANIGLESQVTQ